MNKVQQVIKYFALGLAAFLIIGIFSGIIKLLALGGLIESFVENNNSTSVILTEDKVDESSAEQNPFDSAFFPNIKSLSIDVATAKVKIICGSELSVDYDDKFISVEIKEDILMISENSRGLFNVESAGTLTLTLPERIVFNEAELDFGAGEIDISYLAAKKLDLDIGAGKSVFRGLNISEFANIDGGAGKIEITESSIHDLDLDMGVGDLILSSKITGDSSIDFGVGKANLTLLGDNDEYRIKIDRGLGAVTLSGNSVVDNTYYGNGNNLIEMSGGIGKADINFSAK